MADLSIAVDDVILDADWAGGTPETRRAIEAALPLQGDATRWGQELYFETSIEVPAENARDEVPVGGVAYWPAGNAVCLFWGPTPASTGEAPRAASPVNVFAQVTDVAGLATIDGAARIRIERA